jgi:DUF4097 and DUF4098 domain-containing protein YvlB
MSKATKIWLAAAAGLILSGIITFAVAIIALEFDFSKLSTEKYVTKTYSPEGTFEEIIVDTNLSDIDFLLSPDGKCKVVSMEEENVSHTVEVKDGRLTIKAVDNRKWYDYIGISWENPYLTVYLPETEYKALFVETDVGKVKVSDGFYFETIDLSGNTGDFELTNVTCNSFKADTDTGDISLKNVIAKGNITIETDTGDIEFDRCDALSIKTETDTGDVKGTLLSEKKFTAYSSTGDVRVPNTSGGGKCEITCDTGDINIKIEG